MSRYEQRPDGTLRIVGDREKPTGMAATGADGPAAPHGAEPAKARSTPLSILMGFLARAGMLVGLMGGAIGMCAFGREADAPLTTMFAVAVPLASLLAAILRLPDDRWEVCAFLTATFLLAEAAVALHRLRAGDVDGVRVTMLGSGVANLLLPIVRRGMETS